MVDIVVVSTALGGLSLALGLLYAFYLGGEYLRLKKAEVEARKAELHLSLVRFMTEERFSRALTEILWTWQWTDYDDYWRKYSPTGNPEANNARRLARDYYVSLASLVRRGAVDIELVYELNPSGVTRYWEKVGPIAREFRRRNEYPDYLEPVEWLAGEVEKLREVMGVTGPKKL